MRLNFHRLMFSLLLFGVTPRLAAMDALHLQFEHLRQGDMQLQNVSLQVQLLDAQQLSLQAKIGRLLIPGLHQPLQHISLHCAQLQDSPKQLRCANMQLYIKHLLDTRGQKIAFVYDKSSGNLSLKIPRLTAAGSSLSVNFTHASSGWQVAVQTQQLNLDKFLPHLGTWVTLPKTWTFGGVVQGTLDIQQNRSFQLNTKLHSDNFSFSNTAGTQVGEKLKLDVQLQTEHQATQWDIGGSLQLHSGEVYSEPVYAPVQQTAQLDTHLSWDSKKQQLKINDLHYKHGNILNVQASTLMSFQKAFALHNAKLRIPSFSVAAVQQAYLQTWLEDKGWQSLKAEGKLSVEFDWQNALGKLQIEAQRLAVLSEVGGINGLSGTLHWHSLYARPTHLTWDGIELGNTLAFPAGQLNLRLQGDSAKLLTPLHLPVLDGAVHLAQLELDKLGSAQPQMRLNGRIEPISMTLLSKTLGLPPLGGQLAAVIPKVAYQDKNLAMDGTLLLQVFGGDIVIHHLSLQDPFGALPILNAAIDIKQLDLQTLTHFFEFGEISGRLSGYVKDLQLYKWQPIQFDAFVGTPEGAKGGSISQKAVNNLSNLGGGGVADTLSRGVLSLFESFSYTRLGLGCRLRNKVCTMRGAENSEGGYYLVQGGGLPRIDVKGFNQQVDWDVLLERLKNVTHLGAPVIQ